jgi:hypothetical protein
MCRSEARDLMTGAEEFGEVGVDFTGVDSVGQGFVDEVFRVWADAHPETKVEPVNMNASVEFMVRRGLATAAASGSASRVRGSVTSPAG